MLFSPPADRSASDPGLSPAEGYLAAQTTVLLVVSAWSCGSGVAWAPPLLLALTLGGLPALGLFWRESGRPDLRGFIPLALWVALAGASLCNPSHERLPTGTWWPRAEWIFWLPTTVDRMATLTAHLPWLAVLIQGGTFVAVAPGRRFARYVLGVAAVNGFLLAGLGAALFFSGSDKLLGFVEPPEPTYFFASFFYKNHWAAYGALCALAGMGLALSHWRRTLTGDLTARGRVLLFGAMASLTAVTLPLPRSRSGALFTVLLVAAFFAVLIAMTWQRRRGQRGLRRFASGVLLALALATGAYGGSLYWQRGKEDLTRTLRQLDRQRSGESSELRLLLSRDTWHMARARPWFGWGLGSFPVVFPSYQGRYLRDTDFQPVARFEFAHNDWLQMLAETGLAGLLILTVPVGMVLGRTTRRGRTDARWTAAGCTMIALYAWIDFPFNNPAVLLLWTTLLLSAGALTSAPPDARPAGPPPPRDA